MCISRHTDCDFSDGTKHDHHHPSRWNFKFVLDNAYSIFCLPCIDTLEETHVFCNKAVICSVRFFGLQLRPHGLMGQAMPRHQKNSFCPLLTSWILSMWTFVVMHTCFSDINIDLRLIFWDVSCDTHVFMDVKNGMELIILNIIYHKTCVRACRETCCQCNNTLYTIHHIEYIIHHTH